MDTCISMKKIVLPVLLVTVAVTFFGCSKQKTCTCAVIGDQNVRTITIDGGNCEDVRFLYYDYNNLPNYQNMVDSVLCTDYEFDTVR
ncbi:MAG: hypothetical protein SPJ13_01550 [Bacteroidales bacterium]|nr:hypothetical protein [Bacteroidales bacterium]